jgi:hypothetical protein
LSGPHPATLAGRRSGEIGRHGLRVFAAVRRAELLRSERHSIVTRAIDMMRDKPASESTRRQAGKLLEGLMLERGMSKKQLPPTAAGTITDHAENSDD